MEEETIYAPKDSCGRLQEGYQKLAQNLHFMKPHITMTIMGIPSIIVFEVEVVEPILEYERRQALRKLKKFRWLFGGGSSKVAKLPSLGLLDEGITIAYPRRNRSNSLHMSQPSQFINIHGTKGGTNITTKKQKRSIWIEAHHHGASYGEVGHKQ